MTNESTASIAAIINAAEDVQDPLGTVVAQTALNPSAAFDPATLHALGALRQSDRRAFEELRAALKIAGCRVGALDDAVAHTDGPRSSGTVSQADRLLELALLADVFHTADAVGFADVRIDGRRETWPIRGRGFRQWLLRRYFDETHAAAHTDAVQTALMAIEAHACFGGPEHEVHLRVGSAPGRLYVDLANAQWQAIEIAPEGWRVMDEPPVRFRRTPGMQPLPLPERGGSVDLLRPFLNVQSSGDFALAISWLLAVLRDQGPYPILVLAGEHGSAKSTFCRMVRALVDPNSAPLRALPREDRELFIAARNGHVLTFDNISSVSPGISDTLCRLATGGGFAVRQLYTDHDEVLFDAVRPVMLNGIEDIITRPDLADRALLLTLEPIPEARRQPAQQLWAAFQAAQPRIMGALLDAVAHGLRMLPQTYLDTLPRMADFALWATACEGALGLNVAFGTAYGGNRDDAVTSIIDADAVAATVRTLMASRTMWTGTATDLLAALGDIVGEHPRNAKTWPDSPRALAGRLRRAGPSLRTIGIDAAFAREGRGRTRVIHMRTTAEERAERPSASSAGPATAPPSAEGVMKDGGDEPDGQADADTIDAHPTVRRNAPAVRGGTDADGVDAPIRRPHGGSNNHVVPRNHGGEP